eukprot:m.98277 g.98277  ORF g.98277 m.98277 type:complete len:1596 (+) comp13121_c0_seq3:88-4875(+)
MVDVPLAGQSRFAQELGVSASFVDGVDASAPRLKYSYTSTTGQQLLPLLPSVKSSRNVSQALTLAEAEAEALPKAPSLHQQTKWFQHRMNSYRWDAAKESIRLCLEESYSQPSLPRGNALVLVPFDTVSGDHLAIFPENSFSNRISAYPISSTELDQKYQGMSGGVILEQHTVHRKVSTIRRHHRAEYGRPMTEDEIEASEQVRAWRAKYEKTKVQREESKYFSRLQRQRKSAFSRRKDRQFSGISTAVNALDDSTSTTETDETETDAMDHFDRKQLRRARHRSRSRRRLSLAFKNSQRRNTTRTAKADKQSPSVEDHDEYLSYFDDDDSDELASDSAKSGFSSECEEDEQPSSPFMPQTQRTPQSSHHPGTADAHGPRARIPCPGVTLKQYANVPKMAFYSDPRTPLDSFKGGLPIHDIAAVWAPAFQTNIISCRRQFSCELYRTASATSDRFVAAPTRLPLLEPIAELCLDAELTGHLVDKFSKRAIVCTQNHIHSADILRTESGDASTVKTVLPRCSVDGCVCHIVGWHRVFSTNHPMVNVLLSPCSMIRMDWRMKAPVLLNSFHKWRSFAPRSSLVPDNMPTNAVTAACAIPQTATAHHHSTESFSSGWQMSLATTTHIHYVDVRHPKAPLLSVRHHFTRPVTHMTAYAGQQPALNSFHLPDTTNAQSAVHLVLSEGATGNIHVLTTISQQAEMPTLQPPTAQQRVFDRFAFRTTHPDCVPQRASKPPAATGFPLRVGRFLAAKTVGWAAQFRKPSFRDETNGFLALLTVNDAGLLLSDLVTIVQRTPDNGAPSTLRPFEASQSTLYSASQSSWESQFRTQLPTSGELTQTSEEHATPTSPSQLGSRADDAMAYLLSVLDYRLRVGPRSARMPARNGTEPRFQSIPASVGFASIAQMMYRTVARKDGRLAPLVCCNQLNFLWSEEDAYNLVALTTHIANKAEDGILQFCPDYARFLGCGVAVTTLTDAYRLTSQRLRRHTERYNTIVQGSTHAFQRCACRRCTHLCHEEHTGHVEEPDSEHSDQQHWRHNRLLAPFGVTICPSCHLPPKPPPELVAILLRPKPVTPDDVLIIDRAFATWSSQLRPDPAFGWRRHDASVAQKHPTAIPKRLHKSTQSDKECPQTFAQIVPQTIERMSRHIAIELTLEQQRELRRQAILTARYGPNWHAVVHGSEQGSMVTGELYNEAIARKLSVKRWPSDRDCVDVPDPLPPTVISALQDIALKHKSCNTSPSIEPQTAAPATETLPANSDDDLTQSPPSSPGQHEASEDTSDLATRTMAQVVDNPAARAKLRTLTKARRAPPPVFQRKAQSHITSSPLKEKAMRAAAVATLARSVADRGLEWIDVAARLDPRETYTYLASRELWHRREAGGGEDVRDPVVDDIAVGEGVAADEEPEAEADEPQPDTLRLTAEALVAVTGQATHPMHKLPKKKRKTRKVQKRVERISEAPQELRAQELDELWHLPLEDLLSEDVMLDRRRQQGLRREVDNPAEPENRGPELLIGAEDVDWQRRARMEDRAGSIASTANTLSTAPDHTAFAGVVGRRRSGGSSLGSSSLGQQTPPSQQVVVPIHTMARRSKRSKHLASREEQQ